MNETAATTPLGIYVHWPYCTRICPYCDFNVYKNRTIDADQWCNAFLAELRYWAEINGGRPLRSLYFGGGTPSLAPHSIIESIIDTCTDLWGFEEGAEITLEANPTSAEKNRFQDFKSIGVTRLSLGVQSLRDDALRFLGRDHNAAEALQALEIALPLFPESSFDLIYALPDQTVTDWRQELTHALNLGPKHLSLYQLTIEEGTSFERAVARGAWRPSEEGLAADLFDATQSITMSAGLPAYEVSNHAAPGSRSRHNLLYWRQHDYIGVGPGAHGRVTQNYERLATETLQRPEEYLKQVLKVGNGLQTTDVLSEEAQCTERLSMGLRLTEGCSINEALASMLQKKVDRVTALKEEGLITLTKDRITATLAGRRVLNTILGYLLT